MKFLFTFALILISFVSVFAQTTKTMVKTVPVSDTIIMNVSPLDSVAIEVIDVVSLYSTIEVEVEMNQSETVAKKLVPAFGMNWQQVENGQGVKVTNVTPRKSEVFGTINGKDLEYNRTIKIVVPPNTKVKLNRMPTR